MQKKTISAALVSDALQDEESDLAEPAIATSEAPKRQTAAQVLDIQGIVAAVIAAMQANGQSQAEAIAAAMKEAANSAREPIPENKVSPGVSVFNPLGEREHPLPPLECDTFWGVYDDDGKIAPAFEMVNLKREEIEGLNTITQGEYLVERTDGQKGLVKVQVRKDLNGKPTRKVIAVPHGWFARDKYQHVPSVVDLTEQIQGLA
jgi:hypothetical protein